MKIFLVLILLVFNTISVFAGDLLTTTDHLVFQGKVTQIKDCIVTFKANGKKYEIPAKDIHSIYFERDDDKILIEYLALSESDTNKCLKGSLDAEFLHKRSGEYFLLGFLFGPVALIGAALGNPSPLRGNDTYSKSTNASIFSDPEYLSCYRKRARRDNAKKAALGFASSVLVLPVVFRIILGGV